MVETGGNCPTLFLKGTQAYNSKNTDYCTIFTDVYCLSAQLTDEGNEVKDHSALEKRINKTNTL